MGYTSQFAPTKRTGFLAGRRSLEGIRPFLTTQISAPVWIRALHEGTTIFSSANELGLPLLPTLQDPYGLGWAFGRVDVHDAHSPPGWDQLVTLVVLKEMAARGEIV